MKHRRVVESSNLHEVVYDDEERVLVVMFKGGGAQYRYDGVSKSDFDELVAAESVGKHFAQHIKNAFPSTRLGG